MGSYKKTYLVVALSSIAGIILTLFALSAERYFSSTAFCISCHSMRYPYEEMRRSLHYSRLGINPECGDCHLPSEAHLRLAAHVTEGAKDIISSIRYGLGTNEAFNEKRAEFVEKARANIRAWKGSPCKTCHKNPKPTSEAGKASHERMKKGEAVCVDCHTGIFHAVK